MNRVSSLHGTSAGPTPTIRLSCLSICLFVLWRRHFILAHARHHLPVSFLLSLCYILPYAESCLTYRSIHPYSTILFRLHKPLKTSQQRTLLLFKQRSKVKELRPSRNADSSIELVCISRDTACMHAWSGKVSQF